MPTVTPSDTALGTATATSDVATAVALSVPHGADPGRPHGRATTRRSRWWRTAVGLIVPLLLLAAWQLVTATGVVPAYQLPSPGSVWDAAVDLAQRGVLGQYVAISTQRVLIGFAIGGLLGLAVGSVVGLSRLSAALFAPTLAGARAVPSLAWVPLLVLWIGINEDSKVILIAIGAFFPVYTTVAGALRHVDPHLVEAGRAYGLCGPRLLARVQLPAVVPAVVSGLRLALAQAWLFLVAAELLNSSMGLGFLLLDSGQNGRVDRMILAIVLLAVLGKATDGVVGLAERYLLRRWSDPEGAAT
ncbi:binding-protein-dependent transport systems inner membrane component [Beutenbergia cavernae DSM 12333]|uniref:Binding-protein-dependent transport systems inner membrane component n=1 Tax=Beutenbergia cavernae (strain ATCC BAA-8 / DSM 12333 / CCUG 43141 / JCM 11478 / NBRC 16432 / NCIMB 13614 / HKI 0122) TaxID=471853 RepID=C5C255_BEUC1|nr:ABC transporter permease [Beutenbergia cavernae]ACQ81680.1 binding-protein-dependent transport systems inner membrane component [Beutenbergia cavernae DSM 12333]